MHNAPTNAPTAAKRNERRILSVAHHDALMKAREDDACAPDPVGDMLAAAYAAAKALRDVPGSRVSLGNCGLTEQQVEALADAFEVRVERQVATMPFSLGGPRIIYSFHGVYEAALSGGKYDVAVDGQGSRLATADEAREHGVRTHEDVKTLTGDEAVALVTGGAR